MDLIPNIIGRNAACKCANNKIEKNKINPETKFKKALSYLRREIYHCPTTKIIIVSTKGKAGYLVWKLAGGQGDHDISLPWGSLEVIFFVFCDTEFFVAKPLLIVKVIFSLQ